MKELRLPVIKSNPLPSKILSMDDYLKFVTINLKYIFNVKKNRKHSKVTHVGAPFKI